MWIHRTAIAVGIAIGLVATQPALAQDFDLSWHTIDGGGGTSSGADFVLAGTIGQPDAGALIGGDFELVGGFWPGAFIDAACFGDLTGDGEVGLSDLTIVLANFGTPSGALPEDGDLDGNGTVDLSDLALMLSVFGTVCT